MSHPSANYQIYYQERTRFSSGGVPRQKQMSVKVLVKESSSAAAGEVGWVAAVCRRGMAAAPHLLDTLLLMVVMCCLSGARQSSGDTPPLHPSGATSWGAASTPPPLLQAAARSRPPGDGIHLRPPAATVPQRLPPLAHRHAGYIVPPSGTRFKSQRSC